MQVKTLIDRLCAINMSLGVLCAMRSLLSNLKACRNTLDAIYLAEEILAEREVEIYEQLMEVLNADDATDESAGSTAETD